MADFFILSFFVILCVLVILDSHGYFYRFTGVAGNLSFKTIEQEDEFKKP